MNIDAICADNVLCVELTFLKTLSSCNFYKVFDLKSPFGLPLCNTRTILYYMTKPRYRFPRSKIRSRPDGGTLTASIPKEIVHSMRLQAGDSLEWIWITEGLESYCKVRKII